MKKINEFIDSHYRKIFFFLLVVIFVNTCGNPNKSTNKRVDALTNQVDSLRTELEKLPTKKDVTIEGLKAEKRMIQSTDRKMLDVQRQSAIDSEIKALEK
jgi:hypothetical protein